MTDRPTREDALLPCPFCGSPAESMNYFNAYAVECTNIGKCPAYRLTCSGVNRVEAAKKWNTRADQTVWPPMSGPETEVEEVIFVERLGGKNNLVKIKFSDGQTKTVKQADLTKV